jgi:hypothetical protein
LERERRSAHLPQAFAIAEIVEDRLGRQGRALASRRHGDRGLAMPDRVKVAQEIEALTGEWRNDVREDDPHARSAAKHVELTYRHEVLRRTFLELTGIHVTTGP